LWSDTQTSRQLNKKRMRKRMKVKIPKVGKQLKKKDSQAMKMTHHNHFYSHKNSARLSTLPLTSLHKVKRASLMWEMEFIKGLMLRVHQILVQLIWKRILNSFKIRWSREFMDMVRLKRINRLRAKFKFGVKRKKLRRLMICWNLRYKEILSRKSRS
jgi:hypothetical protein